MNKLFKTILFQIIILITLGGFFVAQNSKAAINKQFNYQGKLTNSSGVAVADGAYDMVFKLYTVGGGGSADWTESWTNAALWTETASTTIGKDHADCGGAGYTKITYTNQTNESTLAAEQTLWNITKKESAVIKSVTVASDYICIYNSYTDWISADDLTNRIYVKDGLFSAMVGTITTQTVDFIATTYYLGVTIGADSEMIPRKRIGAVPQAWNANNVVGDGYVDIDNTSTAQDAVNINYNPASGSFDALDIIYGASGTGVAVNITQSGAGNSLSIDQNGNVGTTISTDGALFVENTGNTDIGLNIYSNIGATADTGLVYFTADNTGFDQTVLTIQQDGTGDALVVTQSGSGNVLVINDEAGDSTPFAIDASGNVGIGVAAPTAKLDIVSVTEQLRLGYDATSYLSVTGDVTGRITFDAIDGTSTSDTGFIFNDAIFQPVYGTDDGLVLDMDFSETTGPEELTDRGLETWTSSTDLTSWTEDGIAAGYAVDREATTVYNGTYSAKLTQTTAVAADFGISQDITVKPSTTYQLNAWVDYNSRSAGSLKLEAYDNTNATTLSTETLSATTTDFQFVSLRFTTASTTASVKVKFYMTGEVNTGTYVAYVDLLSAKEVSTTAYDRSRYGNDGTISQDTAGQGASYADGKYGQGMQFDGADDYVEIPRQPELEPTTNMTIEAWIKKEVAVEQMITGRKQWSGDTSGYMFGVNSSDALLFSAIGSEVYSSVLTWASGQFYHVAVTYNNGSVIFYRDGASVGSDTASSPITYGVPQDIYIGSSKQTTYTWNGSIDQVKIYNRAISSGEVKAHYLRGTETHTDLALDTSTTAGDLYGNRIFLTDTGAVASGTDTSYGQYTSVSRTQGATGGTLNTYGNYTTVAGDIGGTSTVYGDYITATGADTTYGLYTDVSAVSGATAYALYADAGTGAGTEYAAVFMNGNMGIGVADPDTTLEVYNSGNQIKLSFDGTDNTVFAVDTIGDLTITMSGSSLIIDDDLLVKGGKAEICSGGCPTTTSYNPDDTAGDLGVEGAVIAGEYRTHCPTGYIWVPGSAKFGTMPGFCIMKYEASNGGGSTATSDAANVPWVSITQETARAECQELGSEYHLVSEPEWMTIAENIANLAINDMDDDASLQLATGHTDDAPAAAQVSSAGADPVVSGCVLTSTMENASNAYSASSCEIRGDGSYGGDDNDKGFYLTSQAWSATGYSSGAANKAQLRTHILSNGEVVWDIAGNVWEWTDAIIIRQEEPEDATPANEYLEYTGITKYRDLSYVRPPDDGWSSTNGIGKLYTVIGTGGIGTDTFKRGAGWSHGVIAGVFALNLDDTPASSDTYAGFRCAK